MFLDMLSVKTLAVIPCRCFSLGCRLRGRKSRVPFDIRYPYYVTEKQVGPGREGGSKEAVRRVAWHPVQPTGYMDPVSKSFKNVPEMIPEFVVPDLTDFELKPYVNYRAPEITQSEFKAKNLFDACYAQQIVDSHKEGRLKPKSKETESKEDKDER